MRLIHVPGKRNASGIELVIANVSLLTRGADDGSAHRTPSAWMTMPPTLPMGKTCSKSCSQCESRYLSKSGSLFPCAWQAEMAQLKDFGAPVGAIDIDW